MKKLWGIVGIMIALLVNPFNAYAQTFEVENDIAKLLDEHGAIILIVNPTDQSIVYANKAAEKFYGYDKQELHSMKMNQINAMPQEEIYTNDNLASAEYNNFFSVRHKLSNGTTVPVEVYSYSGNYSDRDLNFLIVHDASDKVRLKEDNNKMTAVIYAAGITVIAFLLLFTAFLIFSNIKLKRNNKQIKNLNFLFKTFSNANDNAICLKDEKLKYVFVNTAFERFAGKKENDIIGNDDYKVFNLELAKKFRESDQLILNINEPCLNNIKWQNRIYNVRKFPVKMFNGKYGLGSFVKDVTEEYKLSKMQEQLLERNQILVNAINFNSDSKQEQLEYVLSEAIKLTKSKFGCLFLFDEKIGRFTQKICLAEDNKSFIKLDDKTNTDIGKLGIWGRSCQT